MNRVLLCTRLLSELACIQSSNLTIPFPQPGHVSPDISLATRLSVPDKFVSLATVTEHVILRFWHPVPGCFHFTIAQGDSLAQQHANALTSKYVGSVLVTKMINFVQASTEVSLTSITNNKQLYQCVRFWFN